jgi:N-acetylmuramoyl-L-alanine amidase
LAVASAIDKTSGIVSKNKVDIEIRDLPICVKTNMPSIEVEALYLTNDQDAKLAVSDSWQQYFAQAVADGITAQFPLEK